MRVSISLTRHGWAGGPSRIRAALTETVTAAEDAGLDTVWVADHLLQVEPGADRSEPILEAGTTLGFLAARTERVRLGAMVSAVTFRPPALLIKAVTTLDALSGGRAWFGVGAGHAVDEAAAMGLPFPPTGERFDHLADTVALALRMWSGDDSPFEGRRTAAAAPLGSPRPIRRPPIMIGGTGERRTLPLVARHGDACNVFDIPDGGATVRHKLDVLRRLCDEAGRPYAGIEKTISSRWLPGTPPAEFAARCAEWTSWGIDHAVLITPAPWTPDAIAELSAALPS
jgi:alkanesulfonate monooxygenase SsuD/methylene tetrahydromethanopterin reductase-like flavin-dependent oxidoreductase (luciferase family)